MEDDNEDDDNDDIEDDDNDVHLTLDSGPVSPLYGFVSLYDEE